MEDVLTLYSSIQSRLMRRTLFRGFGLAFLGLLGILAGGVWMSQEVLSHWGIFIFTVGIALIAIGLIPYRRLSSLATKPNELKAIGHERLEFYSRNKKQVSLPFSAIERLSYQEKGEMYGIGIQLHPSFKDQLKMRSTGLNLNPFSSQWHDRFGVDLFFPYFSKRAFEELESVFTHS